jgi:hypothetical protein
MVYKYKYKYKYKVVNNWIVYVFFYLLQNDSTKCIHCKNGVTIRKYYVH